MKVKQMSRENEIRNELRKEKKPSSRKYLIILVVAIAILAGYLALTGEWQNILNRIAPSTSTPRITNTETAGQINSNLGTGLQNASNVLDDISNVLG